MTKTDIICATIDQLLDSIKRSPECFLIEDQELNNLSVIAMTAIIWRFRIEIDGNNIPDPNNAARTIIISYNNLNKTITSNIIFRDVSNIHNNIMVDASASVSCGDWPWLNKAYRKFRKLRKKLIQLKKDKDNLEYLSKLHTIFPTAFDNDLLK